MRKRNKEKTRKKKENQQKTNEKSFKNERIKEKQKKKNKGQNKRKKKEKKFSAEKIMKFEREKKETKKFLKKQKKIMKKNEKKKKNLPDFRLKTLQHLNKTTPTRIIIKRHQRSNKISDMIITTMTFSWMRRDSFRVNVLKGFISHVVIPHISII